MLGALLKGLLGKVIGLVVVLAVIGGIYFFMAKSEGAKAPDVGACVNVTGASFNAEIEEVDCDADNATYVVTADGGNCDADAETNYTSTVNGVGAVDLCLTLNAAKGDCFELGSQVSPDAKVKCADATSNDVKVALVNDSSSDAKACPKNSQAFPNKTRNTLLCLKLVG